MIIVDYRMIWFNNFNKYHRLCVGHIRKISVVLVNILFCQIHSPPLLKNWRSHTNKGQIFEFDSSNHSSLSPCKLIYAVIALSNNNINIFTYDSWAAIILSSETLFIIGPLKFAAVYQSTEHGLFLMINDE